MAESDGQLTGDSRRWGALRLLLSCPRPGTGDDWLRCIARRLPHTSRTLRIYYEQLHGNKLDSLEEMNKFLGKYNLLRLNQEETENMNRLITINEIESVI